MRITNKNNTKPRKEKVYESESFKDGRFTEEELKQYGLSNDEISTIFEYQALLPILQSQNDNSKVNARDLHKQLNNGWKFTDWIENRIKSYRLIKDVDYFTVSRKYETVKNSHLHPKETYDYILTLDCAKQLEMVERTDIGVLVRRYFIIIEKALKNRTNWNTNRKNTLINCKELRSALITKREELLNGVPEWITNGNLYSIEFSLLNPVKLGRCFESLNNRYGFIQGTNQYSFTKVMCNSEKHNPKNQTELAESYGITQQTMNNYMRMANMIPELEDFG